MQKKILKTLWTDKVLEASSINSSLPLPDYPRPQMRRPKWFNLNGKWQYYITRKKDLRNLGGLNIMFDNYKKRGRLNKLIGTEFKVLDKLLDLDSPGSPETKENNEKDGDADGKSMNYCESSGEILVPFCIESYLSGVQRALKPNEILWYKRKVGVPKEWLYDEQGKHNSDRLLIHFGAVDFEARIFINKHYVGGHRGGYTPFTIDITDFIRKEVPNSDHAGDFEIIVGVWDPTDKGRQERGKQVLKPWMIFYTAVSGIWQTVWLEPVPQIYIEDIKITPLLDEKSLLIEPKISSSSGLGGQITNKSDLKLKISIFDDMPNDNNKDNNNDDNNINDDNNNNENQHDEHSLIFQGDFEVKKEILIDLKDVELQTWTPEHPKLYCLKAELYYGDSKDDVECYFGMRKIEVKNDENGVPRIYLNNSDKPIFLYGLLDQGYWPDGLYTPPTDDALIYDIKMAKDMGFNTLRKHIKVELARWYYHCDRLGMIVWQDTPSGGSVKVGAVAPVLFFGKFNIEWGRHKKEVQEGFFQTLREMIEALYNHPSILIWDIFNEGWGQFKTKKAYEFVKNLEKNRTGNRLIDVVSGWVDKGIGDIHDIHKYPGPGIPERKDNRALINGEFGGLGLSITGHLWPIKFKFQYRKLNSKEELFNRYAALIEKLKQLKTQGLSGAIYTELTDVEGEVNGLITYDRKILKIEPDKLKKLHKDITF